jgi:hypothetical protein
MARPKTQPLERIYRDAAFLIHGLSFRGKGVPSAAGIGTLP